MALRDQLNEVLDVQKLDVNLRNKLVRACNEAERQGTLNPVLNTQRVGKHDPHGEAEGNLTHPDQLSTHHHSSTVILCKAIADKLTKQYPGWAWAVQPDERGQIINIYCMNLHTKYGYTIRMVDIMNDPSHREAYRAGGEILRRFNMPNRFDAAALQAAPRDLDGNPIPDISDFASKRQRERAEVAKKLSTGEWEIFEAEGHRYLRIKK